MSERAHAKPTGALDLEVLEIESYCNPGCTTSSTNPACTCPGFPHSTTTSLFVAKTTT
ncbi:MAG TPA: hypothetical protein VIH93_00250 [Thermoanaerobaculia bacterium]|jgi:hypothetical protein